MSLDIRLGISSTGSGGGRSWWRWGVVQRYVIHWLVVLLTQAIG